MDAGFMDDEGFLYIMSRSDDVINVAGHRLSSGALEEVKLQLLILIYPHSQFTPPQHILYIVMSNAPGGFLSVVNDGKRLRLLVCVAARRRRGLRRGRPGGQAEGSRPAGSLRP